MKLVAENFGIPYIGWSQYFNINSVNNSTADGHSPEYTRDGTHWRSDGSYTDRVVQTILKVLQDIKPYMTNP